MAGRTRTGKIAARHCVDGTPSPGEWVTLRPRHLMTHDNSAAIIERFHRSGAPGLRYPWQALITLDHDVQNTEPQRMETWLSIARFAAAHQIDFRPCGSGIGHEIMVSQGFVVPGSLCVAADSHANMYGALGALGTPVVRSDAAAIWATGEFLWQVPEAVEVRLAGRLSTDLSGKDLILALCSRFDRGEVRDAVVEFSGPGVSTLSIEDRLTVANLTTEWGAVAGVFPVDAATLDWMEGVRRELAKRGQRRFDRDRFESWATDPDRPDPDADYRARIEVDLASVPPMAVGPDSLTSPLEPGERIAVDKAFLVGCANARLADLREAAEVLRGHRVHPRVKFYVAAASREVQDDAVREGVWETLVRAGARTLPPGCAMCIGLGEGTLEEGEVAVSATNRNWPGRMGVPGAAAWLTSPRRVARAALDGELVAGPREELLSARVEAGRASMAPSTASLLEGFAPPVSGRGMFLPADDLDTDQLYPSTAVYRQLSAGEMAALVLHHYDPGLAARLGAFDILVGGFNFGCGSSREQAATALMAAGIRVVIAGSLARNFRRNAANNGLLFLESAELVRSLQAEEGTSRSRPLAGKVELDFGRQVVRVGAREFAMVVPSLAVQRLYVDGGLDAQLRRRFAPRAKRSPAE